MNKLNQLKAYRSRGMLIIMAGVLFLTAIMGCNLFNNVPDYIGTWVLEDDFTFGTFTVSARFTLELNEDDTYAIYFETKDTVSGEYVFLQGNSSSTGTFQVDGDTVTMTKMQLEYYNDAWQQTLNPYETETGTYSLSGDTITFYLDDNDDGDTDDYMETLTYTRTEA